MPERHYDSLPTSKYFFGAARFVLAVFLCAIAPDFSAYLSRKGSPWLSANAGQGRGGGDDGDRRGGWGGGDGRGGGDNGDRSGGGGASSSGGDRSGDDSRRSSGRPDNDDGDSHVRAIKHNLEYDANRNMLHFRFKLDRGEGHDKERALAHLDRHHEPQRGDKIGHWYLPSGSQMEAKWKGVEDHRNGGGESWHPLKASETLGRTLKALERQYLGSVPEGTTIISKTKLAIDPSSFSGQEVLAVNLSPSGQAKAEALGFKIGTSSGIPLRQASLTSLIVPIGLDPLHAQELLKRDLPDQQFELNRMYRLYRAATKDSPGQPQATDIAVTGASTRCLGDRCFGREIIRWKDQFGSCARGLKVGVIDTAIDAGHPAFSAVRLHRGSFLPDGKQPASDWHGTGVLSLLAGSTLSGTPGLIPDAEFYAASIFFTDENGEIATDTASLLRALEWMAAVDVKIINMSFSGPRDELVEQAIEQMNDRGVVFVAAAGNEGPTAEPSYPAAYPQVIAVTAVSRDLRNFRYANRGKHIDVSAPGVNIWAAVPGKKEGYHSGTSFAAPFVTSILSILPPERLVRPKEELLDSLQVVDLGPAGRDPIYGRGLLQAPATCDQNNDAVADAGLAANPSVFQSSLKTDGLLRYSIQGAEAK